MAELRIRVGASLERSVEAQFQKLDQAAARAGARVKKEMKSAGAGIAPPMKQGANAAEVAFQKLSDELQGKGRKMMDPATRSMKNFGKETQDAFNAIRAEFNLTGALAERLASKMRKALEEGSGGGGTGRFARSLGYWGSGRMMPLQRTLGMGRRFVGELASGAGIQMNASSLMEGYVNREKLSTTIAHMGFVPGAEGPAGQHVAPKDIEQQAVETSKATGVGSEDILKGLQKFTGFSSDLKTGRDIMMDMAKLASATGASMEDLGEGAGKIAKQLGDVPDKATKVNEVMRTLAGMGRQGAVDIKDFAEQLAKIAPMAASFGGDRAKNIATMGVLLQLGQAGGAARSPQAATDVVRFVEGFKKTSMLKSLKKYGMSTPFDEHGMLTDPRTLILSILKMTGGDLQRMPVELADIFKSAPARQIMQKPMEAFVTAGGGQKGADAAAKAFDEIATKTMSAAEVEAEHAETLKTAASKAKVFQAQLESIADRVATKLIPAMDEFAPKVLSAVDSLGSLTAWAASNPGSALGAAITASFSGAVVQQAARMGLEKLFDSVAGKWVGGGLGAALAGVAIGTLIVEHANAVAITEQKEAVASVLTGANVLAHGTPEEKKAEAARLQTWLSEHKPGEHENFLSKVANDPLTGLIETVIGNKEELDQGKKDTAAEEKRNWDTQNELLRQIKDSLNTGGGRPPVQADLTGTYQPGAGKGMFRD